MIRRKYRWLLFEIFSSKKFSREKIISVLSKKGLELFGSFYAPEFYLFEFDEEKQIGILRCAAQDLDKVRVLLALVRSIDGVPVVINDRFCSGTLKKLKEKMKDLTLLYDSIRATNHE